MAEYVFKVNGITRSTTEDKPLLRYLRDDLNLKSVKDGCSEGACGTCTIIVDGRAVKSCVLTTKKAVGRSIVTVEGLTHDEQEAFVYAFGKVGAVQCGFCIPGMVMAGKALIDKVPDPSEDQIKVALRGNICRCTGYKKIIEGITLAAAILRGDAEIDPELEKGDEFGVGQRAFRTDVRPKVLGYGEYCDDIEMEGMVYGGAVRSKYARARILDIDTSKAEALPGVLAVLTAEDVPNNKVGHIQQDWDVMIAKGDITRMVGDAICLVVGETQEIVDKARKLVKVDYEVLEPVRNVQEAKAPGAPKLHPNGNLCQQRHVVRGDAKKALAESKYTVTKSFVTPFTEHAFLEPECAVAFPYKDGVKVYTSDQGVYDTRKEIAIMLGWEQRRVVVENKYVGGGFGGKEDVSAQHVAVLCALKVGRPVKFRFSRQESINFHQKRHYMEATFTLGCDEDGIFTGFGVTQSEFALESIINLLAEKVGISPWEIRYRNAIEPGKVLPNGQIADVSTALKECLLAVKPAYDANPGRVGIACAMKNSGVGVGLPDKGRCRLEVHDGVVQLYSAASDIGQGCATIFLQELAQTTGLPLSQMKNMGSNSELSPDSGTTSGSRQTLITGEAVRMAAVDLKKDLDDAGGDLSKLEGKEYFAEFFDPTDKLGADVPFPKSHVAYGFAAHVVVLDDEGKVKEVYAAHDSGRVVNPTSIQGQIEGGVLMGMGYALTETFPLEDCVPTARYGTLGLLHSTQIPDIHAIYVEKDELLPFAYGSKGIGEISAIPTAPAVQGAYYFRDGKFRTSLPLEDTYYSKKH